MSSTRSDRNGGSWRARDVTAALVFLAVVAVQVGVPLHRLAVVAAGATPPARFGWQMYSHTPVRLEISVVLDDGSARVVEPSMMLVMPRAEVPAKTLLPALLPALCGASPRARAVAVAPEGGSTDTLPCPP